MSKTNILLIDPIEEYQNPIQLQVAKIETEITTQVALQSTESVNITGWGTFCRRNDGWHGPGGFYGPNTPIAITCEEESAKLKTDIP